MNVQESVLDLQRIEGPFNVANAAGESLFALRQLELYAQPLIAVSLFDGHHMRVQVEMRIACSKFDAGKRQNEADQRFRAALGRGAEDVGVESADYLAANFLPH